jgi:hypothetical protein
MSLENAERWVEAEPRQGLSGVMKWSREDN